jgi:YfiH family protein
MTSQTSGGVTVYRWRILAPWADRMTAVITTRGGGVSQAPYKSLNLAGHVGDSPENVQTNRSIIAGVLNLTGAGWATAKQVHGCEVSHTGSSDDESGPGCDALYSTETRLVSAIFLADCLPVILYDPRRHAGTVCHAGWKGTALGIAGKAVNYMCSEGCRREDIVAAVGPGIGPCCYQVGRDVADAFNDPGRFPKGTVSGNEKTGYRLDLEAANRAVLISAGIDDSRIGSADFCTACRNHEFFSYRKEGGLTGRHGALMILL